MAILNMFNKNDLQKMQKLTRDDIIVLKNKISNKITNPNSNVSKSELLRSLKKLMVKKNITFSDLITANKDNDTSIYMDFNIDINEMLKNLCLENKITPAQTKSLVQDMKVIFDRISLKNIEIKYLQDKLNFIQSDNYEIDIINKCKNLIEKNKNIIWNNEILDITTRRGYINAFQHEIKKYQFPKDFTELLAISKEVYEDINNIEKIKLKLNKPLNYDPYFDCDKFRNRLDKILNMKNKDFVKLKYNTLKKESTIIGRRNQLFAIISDLSALFCLRVSEITQIIGNIDSGLLIFSNMSKHNAKYQDMDTGYTTYLDKRDTIKC